MLIYVLVKWFAALSRLCNRDFLNSRENRENYKQKRNKDSEGWKWKVSCETSADALAHDFYEFAKL